MDQPDFWSLHRNSLVTSSVIGLTLSALLSAGLSWVKHEEANSIEFAAVLNQSTKASIKSKIRSHPQKRVHIKMSGFLGADTPLKVFYKNSSIQECVLTEETDDYTLAWTGKDIRTHSTRSVADAPYMSFHAVDKRAEDDRFNLSHSCFRYARATELANRFSKKAGSTVLSAALDFYCLPSPGRYTHKTYATRVNSYWFTAMDAILDQDDQITLVPSSRLGRASILTGGLEHEEIEKLKASSRNWASLAATLVGAAMMVSLAKKK